LLGAFSYRKIFFYECDRDLEKDIQCRLQGPKKIIYATPDINNNKQHKLTANSNHCQITIAGIKNQSVLFNSNTLLFDCQYKKLRSP